MIPDQIIQSVESSRRTLIVLSKAYVDSMWTKLEFRAAHTQVGCLILRLLTGFDSVHIQALQDKTQRVILVVRDKDVIADKESMEEDLQRYISLNTYLDCEDPWFWQKLRCTKCSFCFIHALAKSCKKTAKSCKMSIYFKSQMFAEKNPSNVYKMLVESTSVVSFKLKASSRSENPGKSKQANHRNLSNLHCTFL